MRVVLFILIVAASCKTVQMNVAIPDQFAARATQLKVTGLNGKRRPQLSFGEYRTSKVKAGWVRVAGHPGGNNGSPLRQPVTSDSKNKFQYTIEDGNLVAEVYCLEKTVRETVNMQTPLGTLGKTKNYQYSFSAIIVPQTIKDQPWQLVFSNAYDSRHNEERKWLQYPTIERQGYVTNGTLRIDIRPILTDKVIGKDGAPSKTLVNLLMAYELKIDGGVIGIIDVFKNNVWIYNDLDKDMKLLVAAISSAILMRKLDEAKI